MAGISTKGDLIRDSGLSFENGVISINRVYFVSGMDPASKSILTDALKAPNIPAYGQRHDVYSFALAKKFKVMPVIEKGQAFHTAAEVIVTYESPNEGSGLFYSIEFGSTLYKVDTDTGTDGKQLSIFYNGEVVAGGGKRRQRVVVPKDVRSDTINYSHWFVVKDASLSYPTPIETLKDKYLNRVNSADFRGGGKHDWKCTVCDGSTQDYGKSYLITIRLEKLKLEGPQEVPGGGWDQWAWWRMGNGEILPEASKKNQTGVKLITNVYLEADFNQIGPDLIALRNT